MISLNYSITKEDYVNYYTYITWDAPENRKKRLIYYARQAIPLLIFLAAFYYTGLLQRNTMFIFVIAGFLILTGLLSLMGVRTNTMRRAERVADNPENASVFLDMLVTISENGITAKDETKETHYHWKAFTKKLESQNYYFLFINALQAVIIPKRAFTNPDEKTMFAKLLSHYLSLDAEVAHLLKS